MDRWIDWPALATLIPGWGGKLILIGEKDISRKVDVSRNRYRTEYQDKMTCIGFANYGNGEE